MTARPSNENSWRQPRKVPACLWGSACFYKTTSCPFDHTQNLASNKTDSRYFEHIQTTTKDLEDQSMRLTVYNSDCLSSTESNTN